MNTGIAEIRVSILWFLKEKILLLYIFAGHCLQYLKQPVDLVQKVNCIVKQSNVKLHLSFLAI